MDVKIVFRCELCGQSSDDTLIMMGLFAGGQLLVCLDCIAEAVDETNCEVQDGKKG